MCQAVTADLQTGVRNPQARNYLRDGVQVGDGVVYYHSSCKVPGVYGFAEVTRAAYPDDDAEAPGHPLFDPKHSRSSPRWYRVDIRPVRPALVPFPRLRAAAPLAEMALMRQPRLSVQPVTAAQWAEVERLAGAPSEPSAPKEPRARRKRAPEPAGNPGDAPGDKKNHRGPAKK